MIGTRAFGDDPELVARHAAAFLVGQQSAGVHACVKHFPGHGDTATDSHLSLAVVASDRDAMLRVALPPFAAAIDAGVAAVMTGHLVVPAVDELPASLSARWTTEILRGEMGFTGVVVTDALEMAAIAGSHGIAGGAVLALRAGADLLCLGGEDAGEVMLDEVRDAIVQAVSGGELAGGTVAGGGGPGSQPGGADKSGASSLPAIRPPLSGWPPRRWRSPGRCPLLDENVLVLRCDEAGSLAVGTCPGAWPQPAPGVTEVPLRRGDPLPLERDPCRPNGGAAHPGPAPARVDGRCAG